MYCCTMVYVLCHACPGIGVVVTLFASLFAVEQSDSSGVRRIAELFQTVFAVGAVPRGRLDYGLGHSGGSGGSGH